MIIAIKRRMEEIVCAMTGIATQQGVIVVTLALMLFTSALYARTVGHDFVNFDDDAYVTNNPAVRSGLTLNGVRWAFTETYFSNWHPVTWLSHMTDVTLFGMNA